LRTDWTCRKSWKSKTRRPSLPFVNLRRTLQDDRHYQPLNSMMT